MMCGIFACCGDCSDIKTKQKIDLALAQLTHRGPDGTRIEYLDQLVNNTTSIMSQGVLPNPGKSGCIGFKRLAIMGTTIDGMQPHRYEHYVSCCNGEIYNYPELKESILSLFKGISSPQRFISAPLSNDLTPTKCEEISSPQRSISTPLSNDLTLKKLNKFMEGSDCTVLIPQYIKFDENITNDQQISNDSISKFLLSLYAEFAMILYDAKKDLMIVANDILGTRQLYYGKDFSANGQIRWFFASELKSLQQICDVETIRRFPTGCFWRSDTTTFVNYYSFNSQHRLEWGKKKDINIKSYTDEAISIHINKLFTKSVEMKLRCDVPYGFLLSGGLDSSLNIAVARRLYPNAKFKTFTIGVNESSPDIIAARDVAKYVNSDHYEYFISYEELFGKIPEIIKAIETWDTTTIRASAWQYALCEKIRINHPEIKVLICGEVSDELWGSYNYNAAAPSPKDSHADRCRLLSEINNYDALRTDKCCMAFSFEARVPHFSQDLLNFVLALDPQLMMFGDKYPQSIMFNGKQTTQIVGEKYLLRKAFSKGNYLPEHILWRKKEAFSDSTSGNSTNLSSMNIYQEVVGDESLTHNIGVVDQNNKIILNAKNQFIDFSGERSSLTWKEYITKTCENMMQPFSSDYRGVYIIMRSFKMKKEINEYVNPKTNEELYYLVYFNDYFSGCHQTIPHYWMPPKEWFPNITLTDPSATILPTYKK
ncbi:MAG: hypothetical protein KIT69_07920 [Propionibacteriaceae bacterium]|nr:hypothetical protein [Propionibacteriaceae bacterium]